MSGQPMKFFDPPPLSYFGGKWQLGEWITEVFPPHGIYVEPFCGGAAVYFRKQPAKIEVLNDLNEDVTNFFRVLRDMPEDLIRRIELTPFAREEYHLAFQPCEDPVERARRFYTRSWLAFSGGGVREKTGFRIQRNFKKGHCITREFQRTEGLWLAVQRLRNAIIECDNAITVIERFDCEACLHYVDPPYLLTSRKRNRERYVHEMTADDHRQLAAVLHEVQGMVVVSGYESPLYRELYGDWRCLTKTNTTNGNSQSVECLWLSPNVTGIESLPLFAGGGW